MADDLSDQIIEGGGEALEVVLDQLLDEGLLKDFPVIGTAIKIADLSKSIRDRLFLAKIQRFLSAHPDIRAEEKEKFQQKIQSDKDFRNRVGEALLLTIERLDSLEKPEMLAKAFAYFVRGKIREPDFRRLASAIDLAFIDDLKLLSLKHKEYNNEALAPLVRAGLAEIEPKVRQGNVTMSGDRTDYVVLRITKLGHLFARAMRDE